MLLFLPTTLSKPKKQDARCVEFFYWNHPYIYIYGHIYIYIYILIVVGKLDIVGHLWEIFKDIYYIYNILYYIYIYDAIILYSYYTVKVFQVLLQLPQVPKQQIREKDEYLRYMLPFGPQEAMEKWSFWTPNIWVKSPLKMKVVGSHVG